MEKYVMHILEKVVLANNTYKFTHKVEDSSPKVHKHLGEFFCLSIRMVWEGKQIVIRTRRCHPEPHTPVILNHIHPRHPELVSGAIQQPLFTI